MDFGQSLPGKDLALSFEHSRKSDLFVVVGSSLVVTPAAEMPKEISNPKFHSGVLHWHLSYKLVSDRLLGGNFHGADRI